MTNGRHRGTDPLVIELSGRVDRLEVDVGDIKKGVATLLERPSTTISWSHVIGTIFTLLATVGIIFGFAEWRLTQAVAPVSERISTHIETAQQQRIEQAVLKERISWMRSLGQWKAVESVSAEKN